MVFRDIKDAAFWQSTYGVCGVSYPNVRLPRLCDKSNPIMDKLEHGKRRRTEALKNSGELLSNVVIFPRDSENDGELTFEE